jgi:hypothetical protein
LNGRKYNTAPLAAYRSSVSRLAPLKSRERKRLEGSIGSWARRSTTTNAAAPSTRALDTSGSPKPRLED